MKSFLKIMTSPRIIDWQNKRSMTTMNCTTFGHHSKSKHETNTCTSVSKTTADLFIWNMKIHV